MLPFGSDRYAYHMTVNMYTGFEQFFKSWEFDRGESSDSEKVAIQEGIATRDLKWVYLATL